MDIGTGDDRVGRYFKNYLKDFVFVELSTEYMRKTGTTDMLKGVPVPVRKEDFEKFRTGDGVSALALAGNMTWIMGIDPHFVHAQGYADFIDKLFEGKTCKALVARGKEAAKTGAFDAACIFFRAALCVDREYLNGMYNYAKICRAMYLGSDDPEYAGRFKAESIGCFELITVKYPDFAKAHYYLGYVYANMGLYLKAGLAWDEFLRLGGSDNERDEIKGRLRQIAGPIEIERGCNMAISGRFEQGIEALAPFMDTQYKTWWPLPYYLGLCHSRLGMKEKALGYFKNVLALNGSHMETMEELAEIYAAGNDRKNEEKYRKKIEIISGNQN